MDKKNNNPNNIKSSELLLEINNAFKQKGIDFLSFEKIKILEYLVKSEAENKERSTLIKLKNIDFQ